MFPSFFYKQRVLASKAVVFKYQSSLSVCETGKICEASHSHEQFVRASEKSFKKILLMWTVLYIMTSPFI